MHKLTEDNKYKANTLAHTQTTVNVVELTCTATDVSLMHIMLFG